jgi:hypothetical protein
MQFRKIIPAYFEKHTKPIYTLRRKNAGLLNAKQVVDTLTTAL